ncbi:LysR family transcriptional regulator [Mesorhizobium sp. CGMCC 1.15528]|uniref:LysR family transcriptional regulator n=1 Tax=Mesorhizobium zhangyense TaxID=1776730 RepID=A0A7C9R9R8_9HYPH|nr:LysR family transcriptional regulator [Mesorhizobium zhangyense]NGN43602.1 LysR family transcriptional regulator [Mesorhizobium zhangyense]
MKIDEKHLIQLAAVVQAGGVTEGASLLGLTQPAVSRTIAQLERRVGEPLFVKGRRPLQPTPLGRALADHGQAMLTASRKASALVDGFRHGRTGVVRIGGSPFFTDALVAGMIAEFQHAYPEVRVEQSYGYLPELRAAINADRIDLAVCPIDILEEGSGLRFQEVLPGRNVVACRVTHPLLMRRKLDPKELLDYPWISPPPGSPLMADLRSLVLFLGATETKIRYYGGSLTAAINYMKASDALTILPHSVVFAYRNEKAITALPINIPHPERALGILHRAEDLGAPAVEAFSNHIQKSFENLKHLIKRHENAVVWGL